MRFGRPRNRLVESEIRRAPCVLQEDERSLHVHDGYDKLMMAGVAGEAAIADAAHVAPLLHRGVSALDVGAKGWPAKSPRTVFSPRSASTSLGRERTLHE